MKIAVLTGLAGLGTATIRDPSIVYPNADYYAFVDRPHSVSVWQTRPIYNFSTDPYFAPRRNAKLAKVLGWLLVPGYDVYIWNDNHCELQMDPEDLVRTYLDPDKDMALFKHAARPCGYAEAAEVARVGVETADNALAAATFLNDSKFPLNAGLFELTSFAYRNNTTMQSAMLTWWELICRYSSRDQVLFPYVVHRHNIKYAYLPGSAQLYGGNNKVLPIVRDKHS